MGEIKKMHPGPGKKLEILVENLKNLEIIVEVENLQKEEKVVQCLYEMMKKKEDFYVGFKQYVCNLFLLCKFIMNGKRLMKSLELEMQSSS